MNFSRLLWIFLPITALGCGPKAAEEDTACGDGSVSLTASGIEFVKVCGGTFDMGCTPGQSRCDDDDLPVRTTTLTRDYYMGRTEVTQGQFQAVMGRNPSEFAGCGSTCPVEIVSWHEAAAFANAVSAAAGLASCYACTGSGTSVSCTAPADPYVCAGYRLPTEAEWEGAARCGTNLVYAGSDTIGAVAWYMDNSGSTPHAVGGLPPNACGLYDMSGNVAEWTHDWFSDTPYSLGSSVDPTGPASGHGRVGRGGSWGGEPWGQQVSYRYILTPEDRYHSVGFRLLRTAP